MGYIANLGYIAHLGYVTKKTLVKVAFEIHVVSWYYNNVVKQRRYNMLKVKELLEEQKLNMSDVCTEITDYSNSDSFEDVCHEIADSEVGIYYKELDDFLVNNISEVEAKMEERQSYDIYGAVRELQYEETYNTLCSEEDDMKLLFAYQVLIDNDIEEITEDQQSDIEFNCDSYSDLWEIRDYIQENIVDPEEEEEEEEEE